MKYLMLLFYAVSLVMIAMPVTAFDWRIGAGDVPFDAQELAALPGQSFVFFDDGEALFGAAGAYAYTYSAANGGGTSWGSYHVAADGSVCVDYGNDRLRCDLYVRNGTRVIVITETGQRYPVR